MSLTRGSRTALSTAVAARVDPPAEERWWWAFAAVLLVRLRYPFFNSPLSNLYSGPLRHSADGARFLSPDLIGAGDPDLYQVWMYLPRSLSGDSPPTVLLAAGIPCSAIPYG